MADNFFTDVDYKIRKSLLDISYETYNIELGYIDNCLSFMDTNISSELKKITTQYEEDIKETSNQIVDFGFTERDFLDEHYGDKYREHEDISKTFLEAILIRQISIVEKFLVKLSFTVYQELKNATSQECLLPPNEKVHKEKNFTDAIAAADYINTHLDIRIKDHKVWKIFMTFRQIRHKLAHGEILFVLDQGDVENYNKDFSEAILIEYVVSSDTKLYKINNLFKPIDELNSYLKTFIIEIKDLAFSKLYPDE